MVSKLASDHVKMVLTGDGGDELFMGYGSYNWARRLNNPFVKLFRNSIHTLLWHSGSNRNKRASLLFDHPINSELTTHIFSQEQYYFSRGEVKGILKEKYIKPSIEGTFVGSIAISEPGAGSDVAGLRMTATRDGDHYILNGNKTD